MTDAFAALLCEPGTAQLMALLNGGGEETRVVGGAVRNLLTGHPHADIDLATTALPQVVMARANDAGVRCVPTGIAHGTVTLLVDGLPHEVTTLREDIATDGRHATVRFGRDFMADALRRDFTINALSVSIDGVLHDYTGGVADIASGRVRFIGAPAQRIAEDHLRSLRFFRFHAAYGTGPPDAAGLAGVIASRDGLASLSRERVRAEMLRLLVAPGAAGAIEVMSDAGLMALLTGGMAYAGRLARLIGRGGESDALLCLAAACVLVAEDADRLRDRFRLAKHEHQRLVAAADVMAHWHGRKVPPNRQSLMEMLFLHGRTASLDALALLQVQCPPGAAQAFAAAAQMIMKTRPPRLPVSGDDLLRRGALPGPIIGRVLKSLQASWIRAGFPKDPAVIAHLLDDAIARANIEL